MIANREKPRIKTFGVVRSADVWLLTAPGNRLRRFPYRVDAEEAALRLAGDAMAQGDSVEVLVQNWAGEMTRIEIDPHGAALENLQIGGK